MSHMRACSSDLGQAWSFTRQRKERPACHQRFARQSQSRARPWSSTAWPLATLLQPVLFAAQGASGRRACHSELWRTTWSVQQTLWQLMELMFPGLWFSGQQGRGWRFHLQHRRRERPQDRHRSRGVHAASELHLRHRRTFFGSQGPQRWAGQANGPWRTNRVRLRLCRCPNLFTSMK